MLDPSAIKFHRSVIRLVRGVITSWEQWVDDQEAATTAALLRKERARLDSQRENV